MHKLFEQVKTKLTSFLMLAIMKITTIMMKV